MTVMFSMRMLAFSTTGLQYKVSEKSGTVKITFLGPVLHQEAMRQLASQDIYLLFSEFE